MGIILYPCRLVIKYENNGEKLVTQVYDVTVYTYSGYILVYLFVEIFFDFVQFLLQLIVLSTQLQS